MEEIKVGEYIRTPWGNIEKVERIDKAENEIYADVLITNNNAFTVEWLLNRNAEHSFNPIDVIKVGDIIEYESGNNGMIVKREVCTICTEKEDYKWGEGYVSTLEDEFVRHNQIYSVSCSN